MCRVLGVSPSGYYGTTRGASVRPQVEHALGLDRFAPKLYVFCNRKRDKIKILYWERTGFVLCPYACTVFSVVALLRSSGEYPALPP